MGRCSAYGFKKGYDKHETGDNVLKHQFPVKDQLLFFLKVCAKFLNEILFQQKLQNYAPCILLMMLYNNIERLPYSTYKAKKDIGLKRR